MDIFEKAYRIIEATACPVCGNKPSVNRLTGSIKGCPHQDQAKLLRDALREAKGDEPDDYLYTDGNNHPIKTI